MATDSSSASGHKMRSSMTSPLEWPTIFHLFARLPWPRLAVCTTVDVQVVYRVQRIRHAFEVGINRVRPFHPDSEGALGVSSHELMARRRICRCFLENTQIRPQLSWTFWNCHPARRNHKACFPLCGPSHRRPLSCS